MAEGEHLTSAVWLFSPVIAVSAGGLYAWELEKNDREVRVRVEGQLSCNNTATIVQAATRGVGLGFVMESSVANHVARGQLVRVLEDWC